MRKWRRRPGRNRADTSTAVAQLSLADRWRTLAQAVEEPWKTRYLARALFWFQRALPSLDEPEVLKLQTRMRPLLGGHGLLIEFYNAPKAFAHPVANRIDTTVEFSKPHKPAVYQPVHDPVAGSDRGSDARRDMSSPWNTWGRSTLLDRRPVIDALGQGGRIREQTTVTFARVQPLAIRVDFGVRDGGIEAGSCLTRRSAASLSS